MLPEKLLGDFQHLEQMDQNREILEVIAACMRHREAALLHLQYEGLLWPVTLFPAAMTYQSPRDLAQTIASGLMHASLHSVEPPGVRPPGNRRHEGVSSAQQAAPRARRPNGCAAKPCHCARLRSGTA